MASIIFKDKFEQEHWEKLTVTFDDYTEPNFFGLKIDDSKRQIILRLHKSELKQIMRKSGLLTEVIKQAKIEENEMWNGKFHLPTNIDFDNRINQLKGE